MRRGVCAGAVALLADDKQQAEIADSRAEQAIRRADHRRDDALGVRRAASPDEFGVFAGREEGRHGVHVGGKRHVRFAPVREYVEAVVLRRRTLHLAAGERGQLRESVDEEFAHRRLMAGDGLDVHHRTRQFKNVHAWRGLSTKVRF